MKLNKKNVGVATLTNEPSDLTPAPPRPPPRSLWIPEIRGMVLPPVPKCHGPPAVGGGAIGSKEGGITRRPGNADRKGDATGRVQGRGS